MRHFVTSLKALAVVLLGAAPVAAFAEDSRNPCGSSTVTSGSGDVVVEGKQAARAGDTIGCPGAGSTIVQGSPNVFINGKPAAVQGDQTGCGGSIVTGASGVFINGKPMARVGDGAGCGGK
jgi:uncharacterized Zn-binding protein involved in type VI secretion